MSELLFELKNITKTYGKGDSIVHALNNTDFSINKGESVAIMGKSGSGKSTLLNIIGGLDSPDSGEYIFNGEKLPVKNLTKMAKFRRYNIGFVVQHFALINEYSVYQNISLPLRYTGKNGISLKEKIEQIAERLEIAVCAQQPCQLLPDSVCNILFFESVSFRPRIGVLRIVSLVDEDTDCHIASQMFFYYRMHF